MYNIRLNNKAEQRIIVSYLTKVFLTSEKPISLCCTSPQKHTSIDEYNRHQHTFIFENHCIGFNNETFKITNTKLKKNIYKSSIKK